MKLGLWMSPLHFNMASKTFAAHPEWGCEPYTAGLGAYSQYEPESGSNEAGVAPWGPAYIPFLEGRITKAITEWDVKYFKFDFIAWLDCLDQGDIHDFRDAFVAMLDRLRGAHPDVTFSIDETNDYRLFPFQSTLRGPTWFQNGNPAAQQLLHNLWNLSPYVPAAALGQHIAVSGKEPLGTRMAAALLSHTTFFTDIRQIPADTVPQIREWIDFYRANRSLFTRGAVHPLVADPLAGGWTALQSWDPEKGRGALLAFRQSAKEATRRIALVNVPSGETFEVRRAPAGEVVGEYTSAQLGSGIDVTLPEQGAEVLTILRK
jgi:alpha-galactosidase